VDLRAWVRLGVKLLNENGENHMEIKNDDDDDDGVPLNPLQLTLA
jgi:hypothetical protein